MTRQNLGEQGSLPRSDEAGKAFQFPWGKSAPSGAWHSVIGHSLDVAIVARHIMSLPVMRARLSGAFSCSLEDAHIGRLTVVAGLHDAGKCLAGFQAKLREKLPIGQGHVNEFLAVLTNSPPIQHAVDIDRIAEWFDDPAQILFPAWSRGGRECRRSIRSVLRHCRMSIHGRWLRQ